MTELKGLNADLRDSSETTAETNADLRGSSETTAEANAGETSTIANTNTCTEITKIIIKSTGEDAWMIKPKDKHK
ncbi:unnamed protein product [Rotaria sp. Silwood1]|nr:unnamed protein product [Rotaria sp. Silwood1]CAF1164724.1 unnamed protein product [Rotaria sp. Silwood1]